MVNSPLTGDPVFDIHCDTICPFDFNFHPFFEIANLCIKSYFYNKDIANNRISEFFRIGLLLLCDEIKFGTFNKECYRVSLQTLKILE